MNISAFYSLEQRKLLFYEDSACPVQTRKESVGFRIVILDSLIKHYEESQHLLKGKLELKYKKMNYTWISELEVLRSIYSDDSFDFSVCQTLSKEEAEQIINSSVK